MSTTWPAANRCFVGRCSRFNRCGFWSICHLCLRCPSNDEVTDRRVNCHGRRQRIPRPNGHGPRRFGGPNGSTGYGRPHHEGREGHEDRMRNPQPARRSDCPPSCSPAPGPTKPTRLRSRRTIPTARHSIWWFVPSSSDHPIRSSSTRRSRCGCGIPGQSPRPDIRSGRCHFHCRTTQVSDRRRQTGWGAEARSERAAGLERSSGAAVRLDRVVRLTVPTLRIAPSIPSVKSV